MGMLLIFMKIILSSLDYKSGKFTYAEAKNDRIKICSSVNSNRIYGKDFSVCLSAEKFCCIR